jgi:hypothetical protein
MCWNKDISLNTFLFSSFVLGLIVYNNKYTRYKIKEFEDFWLVIFFMVFIMVQLVEYFVWININNPLYNTFFSSILLLITVIQPVISLMMLKNYDLKFYMILSYLIIIISYFGYTFPSLKLNSVVSTKCHLDWNYIHNNNIYQNIVSCLWLFFFLFSLFYEKKYLGLFFGILTLIVILYNFMNDRSFSSMWCWIANMMMIFYATYLLFYLPATT